MVSRRTCKQVAVLGALSLVVSVAVVMVVAARASATAPYNGITFFREGQLTFPLVGPQGSNVPFVLKLDSPVPTCSVFGGDQSKVVYSFLVPTDIDPTSVTFQGGTPSIGYGYLDRFGNYVGPVPGNGTGLIGYFAGGIFDIFVRPAADGFFPLNGNALDWSKFVNPAAPTPRDLVDNGTDGTWRSGFMCVDESGRTTGRYWERDVKFTLSDTDPNGFTWTPVDRVRPPTGFPSVDVFVGSFSGDHLLKFAAVDGTVTTVGSGGVFNAAGLALNAGGDVFVADFQHDRVLKFPPAGGPEQTVGTGFEQPTGVALDDEGNLFVVHGLDGRIDKVTPSGQQTTVTSGLSGAWAVAVDHSGNLFVTSRLPASDEWVALEIPIDGSPRRTIAGGLRSPFGLAIDQLGDLFVADSGNDRVLKIPAGGGPPTTVGTGFVSPDGVAVDSTGNVYVSDSGHGQVVEVSADGRHQSSFAGPGFEGAGAVSATAIAVAPSPTPPSVVPEAPWTITLPVSGAIVTTLLAWRRRRATNLVLAAPTTTRRIAGG